MNSKYVSYSCMSPHFDERRGHRVDTISIVHNPAGLLTLEEMAQAYSDPKNKLSTNYGIDKDGRVGLFVDENHRSYCTNFDPNDQRSISIEIAFDINTGMINQEVLVMLRSLTIDIFARHNIFEPVFNSNKISWLNGRGNVTVQNMFDDDKRYDRFLNIMIERTMMHVASELGIIRMTHDYDTEFIPYLIQIIKDGVSLMSGPSYSSDKMDNAILLAGVDYKITEEVEDEDYEGRIWGRIEDLGGWVNLDYTKSRFSK